MDAMTWGGVLVGVGLLICVVQWFLDRQKVKPQSTDPIDGVERVLGLIKQFGLGLVITAVGLVIMLIAAVSGG